MRDGSQIELNTDSAVRVALSETERKVWLDRARRSSRCAITPGGLSW